MSCERNRDALTSAAAGGPLAPELEAHLASCERCRHDLAELRQALAIADAEMSALAAAEPSPGLAARIRQSAAASGVAPAWRLGWLWPATAVAAALLVALAVWVTRAPSPEPRAAEQNAAGAATPNDVRRSDDARERPGAARGPSAREGPAVPPPVSSRAHAAARAVRRVPPAPEVLVPPGEAEALERFAAELQHRAVAPDSFLLADLSAPLTRPVAIEIPPLEIEPLYPDTSGTD